MKLSNLTLLCGLAAALPLSAQTIITGETDYVGDFEGVTFDEDVNTSVLFSSAQLGEGWRATPSNGGGGQWTVTDDGSGSNDIAFRDNVNRFAPYVIGITFDGSSLANEDVILSFDYAQVSRDDNNGDAGWLLIGSNLGDLTNNNDYGYLQTVNDSRTAINGTDAKILYDGRISANALSSSGTVTASFNMENWNQYTFVYSSNAASAVPTTATSFVDNVAISIPETNHFGLISGIFGAALLFIRRR